MPDFDDLARNEPSLRALADDARSIARNARWDWYSRWIHSWVYIKGVASEIAGKRRLRENAVRQCIVDHLLAVYRRERARKAA